MKTLWIAATTALFLVACGEHPQVIQYKQGEYQGKVDARPYDNAAYNGDKTKWENDIRGRGQLQNEYKRTN